MMFLFAMLLLSAVAFADVGPDYESSCYCCGGPALIGLVGLVFLLERKNQQ